MRPHRTLASMTRSERYAMQLVAADLNTRELAFAMSWPHHQAVAFCARLRRMVGAP